MGFNMDRNSAPQQQPGQNGVSNTHPNPEVKLLKSRRRTFTVQEKLKVLDETDALAQGDVGAHLRKKGIYWSTLCKWRQQREAGLLGALGPKKRGARPRPTEERQLAQLEDENRQLRSRLDQAEKIIDVQKKLCELFGLPVAKKDEPS
jgi:transposase-like protein